MSELPFTRKDAEGLGWRFDDDGGAFKVVGDLTRAMHVEADALRDEITLAQIAEIEGRGFVHGYGLPIEQKCEVAWCCPGGWPPPVHHTDTEKLVGALRSIDATKATVADVVHAVLAAVDNGGDGSRP